jgi:hypothetical protein
LDFHDAIVKLRECRTGADNLSDLFMSLELSEFIMEPWRDEFADALLELLRDTNYLRLQDSWRLVYLINNNWEQITGEQRKRMREPLGYAFQHFEDWMGAFLISEILGERYNDEESLAILSRLERTAGYPTRALVPHGLEGLAKVSENSKLRELAIQKLRELADSSDAEVKREAQLSLSKLGLKT